MKIIVYSELNLLALLEKFIKKSASLNHSYQL